MFGSDGDGGQSSDELGVDIPAGPEREWLEESAEPEEFDPEDIGPDIPSPQSPSEAENTEAVRLFVKLVVVFNAALLALALGPMFIVFLDRWEFGLQLFSVGVLIFAYGTFRYYQFRTSGDDTGANAGDGCDDGDDGGNDPEQNG